MGSTAIQNTPTLRAYNEGGYPVNICASIRASWLLLDDPSNPGTFPCAAGAVPSVFNGYMVESIASTKRDGLNHTNDKVAIYMAPNAWGTLENGTIYAPQHDSQVGKLYDYLKITITTKEIRSFIITYAENVNGENAIVFRA
jgi:hypothetical protein